MQQIVCYRGSVDFSGIAHQFSLIQHMIFNVHIQPSVYIMLSKQTWSLFRNHNSNNNLPTIYSVRQSTWHFTVSLTFITILRIRLHYIYFIDEQLRHNDFMQFIQMVKQNLNPGLNYTIHQRFSLKRMGSCVPNGTWILRYTPTIYTFINQNKTLTVDKMAKLQSLDVST